MIRSEKKKSMCTSMSAIDFLDGNNLVMDN
jgi:hypothetical protein